MAQKRKKNTSTLMRRRLKAPAFALFSLAAVIILAVIVFLRVNPPAPRAGAPLATLPALRSNLATAEAYKSGKVVDLSGWQPSAQIDYDKLAPQIIGAIVRVQSGLNISHPDASADRTGKDTAYQLHMTQLQQRGIPVAVYAYVSGTSVAAMKDEADAFYARAKDYQPTFWFLDIEDTSLPADELPAAVEAYRAELSRLGARHIGIYSTPAFLTEHAIDTTKFQAVWLAAYGANTGNFSAAPQTTMNYQMQQYTNAGSLDGFAGKLDLSLVTSESAYQQIFLNK